MGLRRKVTDHEAEQGVAAIGDVVTESESNTEGLKKVGCRARNRSCARRNICNMIADSHL